MPTNVELRERMLIADAVFARTGVTFGEVNKIVMSDQNHEALVEEAKAAINKVFGDTSVGNSVTRESLDELAGEIETLQDALDADEYTETEDGS